MKWILIFYIAVTPGGGPESVEFNTFEACEQAVDKLEMVDTEPGVDAVGFCTSKGSEE